MNETPSVHISHHAPRRLGLLIFAAGFVTLGMELSASRLLEPAFGNNQLVWAALIGMILLYLAIGAWLGGRLADRFPHRFGLDLTLTVAALGVALIPALSRPVLRMASTGIETFAPGILVGALLAILLLFGLPGVLLGTATPWAVRLSVQSVQAAGQTAGRLSALATVGSLLGAFVPVLWLIPFYGTRWTFFMLALFLLVVLLLLAFRQKHFWIPLAGLLLTGSLILLSRPGGPISAPGDASTQGQLLYEDESHYNYIAVRQWGSERHLKLNDGTGIHSVYHPDTVLSLGIWDYFLLAPFFRTGSELQSCRFADLQICSNNFLISQSPISNLQSPVSNLLIIGSAAGTISELYTNLYGSIPITGIELDPQIIEVGQQYFGMNQPNVTVMAADGRHWLAQQSDGARWDVIAVDAYRPPYIPFHLTTVEFFELVRSHLSAEGVLAINVGRTANNFDLVDALAETVIQVFPAVYLIDEPGPEDNLGNTLLVATMQPIDPALVVERANSLPESFPSEFREFARTAITHLRPADPPPDATIFTDDRAPVEMLIHRIILDFITQ